jgi:hypothetical protein
VPPHGGQSLDAKWGSVTRAGRAGGRVRRVTRPPGRWRGRLGSSLYSGSASVVATGPAGSTAAGFAEGAASDAGAASAATYSSPSGRDA